MLFRSFASSSDTTLDRFEQVLEIKGLSSALCGHTISSNDGRCVQVAGTQSVQADDLHILGIPCSRQTIASIYPKHGPDRAGVCKVTHSSQSRTSRCWGKLAAPASVVRVQPRTFRSITDLLLTLT